MLDFYFAADDQIARIPRGLQYAGGIETREFQLAQQAGLIESSADYYGRFRWSSAQVMQKAATLSTNTSGGTANLMLMLREASSATLGLVAFGD